MHQATAKDSAPMPSDKNQPDNGRTMLDYLDKARLEFPDHPAFSQNGHTLSFGEVDQLSTQIAAYLQSLPQLKQGDRVAIQLPNILAYPIIAYGVIKAGLVMVNTNPLYTPRETLRQLQNAGVKVWFVAETAAHIVAQLADELQNPSVIVCELFAMHPSPQRWMLQFYLHFRKRAVVPYARQKLINLRQALRIGKQKGWQRPKIQPQDLLMLQYTGGSTGIHKGAMLTHANLVSNMEQVQTFLNGIIHQGQEVVIAPLPLCHIFAFTVHCGTPLLTGAHNVLILDPTAIRSLVKELQRWPFTSITGVNTLFHSLLRNDAFRKMNFQQLRFAIAGGMKLDPKVARQWEEVTGRPILEGFGMTELSPVASFNPPEANRIGSIGKPVPLTTMKILDAENQPITATETAGELWIRGPQVMLGYWQNPEETARHMTADGWMRTGDLASFDADGYWHIVGRVKRMILVSGFNVYPIEIEEVLRQHPDVLDCKVIGIPHPITGETIKAQIVSKNKTLKAQDIREHCRRFLTSYKLPKQIEFVETLLKTEINPA